MELAFRTDRPLPATQMVVDYMSEVLASPAKGWLDLCKKICRVVAAILLPLTLLFDAVWHLASSIYRCCRPEVKPNPAAPQVLLDKALKTPAYTPYDSKQHLNDQNLALLKGAIQEAVTFCPARATIRKDTPQWMAEVLLVHLLRTDLLLGEFYPHNDPEHPSSFRDPLEILQKSYHTLEPYEKSRLIVHMLNPAEQLITRDTAEEGARTQIKEIAEAVTNDFYYQEKILKGGLVFLDSL